VKTTIHAILEQKLIRYHSWPKADRRVALQVARSLQRQLFFYEVEWGSRTLQDGLEDVYMFLDDPEESSMPERAELPSGVVTMLTKCYSIMCSEGTEPCYSYCCPLRVGNLSRRCSASAQYLTLTGYEQVPDQHCGAEWEPVARRLDLNRTSPSARKPLPKRNQPSNVSFLTYILILCADYC